MSGVNLTRGALPKEGKTDGKLIMIRHIGVSLDRTKLSADEQQVNKALEDGYEIIHKFETGMGMVYVMGHYGIPPLKSTECQN